MNLLSFTIYVIQEEYIKEGVTGVDITYQDNQPVLELFLSRPLGLISLLDEQCRTNVRVLLELIVPPPFKCLY